MAQLKCEQFILKKTKHRYNRFALSGIRSQGNGANRASDATEKTTYG